ncbi:MAG: hypothetical protein E6J18_06475 [Chloroflexi bacterium]|nr:MAG: hypothetical protein E6J18_06475 [Chloroflexota bacterium]
MGRVEEYRAELRRLPEWEAYLKKNSGLPGARANLELVEAVGEEADPERLWRLSASSDEFLALCGTAGLGHLAVSDPVPVMSWLRELAADPRWRVREGVAIALQHLGRHSMPRLLAEMDKWSTDGPYLQRAAAAGLCEPSLLKEPEHVTRVLGLLDRMTRSLAASSTRRGEEFRVLRQALGYCWSVAAAALPEAGRPLMEKWLRSPDKDVAWVMTSNLSKARIGALGPGWVTKWRARATAQARVTARPAADIATTKPYGVAPPAKPASSAPAKKPAARKPVAKKGEVKRIALKRPTRKGAAKAVRRAAPRKAPSKRKRA